MLFFLSLFSTPYDIKYQLLVSGSAAIPICPMVLYSRIIRQSRQVFGASKSQGEGKGAWMGAREPNFRFQREMEKLAAPL
jgi:hypothetical protein